MPAQDTSARYVVPPLPLGTTGYVQDVPFQEADHACTAPPPPISGPERPTAMQLLGEPQETLSGSTTVPLGRAGRLDSVHVVPFHCADRSWSDVLDVAVNPTARQYVVLVHATPPSRAVVATGVPGTMVHAVPFHCSINVAAPLLPRSVVPTATQKDADTHDTCANEGAAPPVLGKVTGDHVAPFQSSA